MHCSVRVNCEGRGEPTRATCKENKRKLRIHMQNFKRLIVFSLAGLLLTHWRLTTPCTGTRHTHTHSHNRIELVFRFIMWTIIASTEWLWMLCCRRRRWVLYSDGVSGTVCLHDIPCNIIHAGTQCAKTHQPEHKLVHSSWAWTANSDRIILHFSLRFMRENSIGDMPCNPFYCRTAFTQMTWFSLKLMCTHSHHCLHWSEEPEKSKQKNNVEICSGFHEIIPCEFTTNVCCSICCTQWCYSVDASECVKSCKRLNAPFYIWISTRSTNNLERVKYFISPTMSAACSARRDGGWMKSHADMMWIEMKRQNTYK